MSEQHASTIPHYRRLLRTARRDYESDLTPELLPAILCDAIAGTSKTLAEVWNMPADEFERFWTAKENPLPKAPLLTFTKMTLGRFFDALAQIERDSHPSGPLSCDSHGYPSPPAQELHAKTQYVILLEGQKQALRETPGYEAFRTFLLREFGLSLASASRDGFLLELLKRGIVGTVAEAEALPLEDVEEICKKNMKGNRDRPNKSDPKDDEIMGEAWERYSRSGRNKADFIKEFPEYGLTKTTLDSVLHRNRDKPKPNRNAD